MVCGRTAAGTCKAANSSAMKQPAFGCIVLGLSLFHCSCVSAVYTIRRNTQDCIYPLITAEAVRLWPTSAYLPRGNSIRSIAGGGYLVTAGCTDRICHLRSRPCFRHSLYSFLAGGQHCRLQHRILQYLQGQVMVWAVFCERWAGSPGAAAVVLATAANATPPAIAAVPTQQHF